MQALLERLQASIGQDPNLNNEEYDFLIKNIRSINQDKILDYQVRVIEWLCKMKGKVLECPNRLGKNTHLGDCLEWHIGLNRNNSLLGDLLGIELKSWDGSSNFSIVTYSIEKDLKNHFGLSNINQLLCGEKLGSPCTNETCNDSRHVLFRNETLYCGKENRLKRVKFDIVDNHFVWFVREKSEYKEIARKNLNFLLQKYVNGFVSVLREGKRKEKKIQD